MNLPKRVTLELTNKCNRACTGCPRHQMRYPYGNMNIGLFSTIIDQLPDSTTIVPFFRGESTSYEQFSSLMLQLRRFRTVQLATNGDFLDKWNKRAILENVTFLSLSLHKFKLPVETDWLPFLHEACEAGLTTQISIVESELPPKWHGLFIREWGKHVNRVRIYREHSKNGFGSLEKQSCVEPCTKPFEEMVVYWDGKVGLCNHDWNNMTALGDLNKNLISEVWNNSKYQTVRALHSMKLRKQIETCRDCTFKPKQVYGEIINAHN